MDSSYDSGSSSDSPSSPRTKKRRSLTNYDNISSVKYVRCGGGHVSSWNHSQLESYGIFYDEKATGLCELYNSAFKDVHSLAVKGREELTVFWTKLQKMKETLIELTKKCLHSLDVDGEFSKMNMIKCMAVEKETVKCLDALTKIKEEIAVTMESDDNFSRHVFSLWHAGIVEYVQYYSQLIKDLSFDRRLGVEGEFCQLLTYLTRIFLLNPIRGDATGKVQLSLYGLETTSSPDLRFSIQREYTAEERDVSVITATVAEVKMWSVPEEENTVSEFDIRNLKLKGQSLDRLLGRHGGELLLESTKSALQTTNLGIICVKTMIIFTCLEMDTEHLSCLQEGSPVDSEKRYIHYSKPYNFLVREDREEILGTLFHLGLLCRINTLYFFNQQHC